MMLLEQLFDACLWTWKNVWHIIIALSGLDHIKEGKDSDNEGPIRTTGERNGEIIDESDEDPESRRQDVCRTLVPKGVKMSLAEEEFYRMKNPYCLVIVNIHYHETMVPRNGAEADRKNIEQLLIHTAGFKAVTIKSDQTRMDILELLDGISKSPQMHNHDGLVVFISSHGKAQGILTVDRKTISTQEMTSRLNGRQCEGLRGKPKLFFIAACRGRKTDPGVPFEGMASSSITHDSGEEETVPRLPTDADFLICYSTSLDFISYRRYGAYAQQGEAFGTWLISAITQIFIEYMETEDIMQMLARVNNHVANMSRGDRVDGAKQMPVQMHRLRVRLFFGNPRKTLNTSNA